MKKILCFLISVFVMSGVVISSGVVSEGAWAKHNYDCPAGSKAGLLDGNTFLGFRPWYYGLCIDKNTNSVVAPNDDTEEGDNFVEFVWEIILNVVFDLFFVIGIIAVGFVIYGGYMFIAAGGDAGKVAKAKKVLTAAIVGILVSLSATVIVSTITDVIGI